jgi:large subunit ribosomal protein L22
MKEATAELNNYRQSPRKVRRVASAVRGKKISEAKNILNFLVKRSSGPIHSLLNSAVANAKEGKMSSEGLFVKSITVNQGKILYRRRPAAHGAAHPIRKRTSKIKITLSTK